MKNLKLSLGILLISVIASNAIQAQAAPKLSDDKKQEMVSQMQQNKERLALTHEQQVPFKEVSKKYAEQMKEVRGSSLERKEKFEKIKAIQSDKNAEIKTLLTEAQFKVYLEMQQEKKAKMMAGKQ